MTQGYQVHPSISLFEANANAGALQTLTDFTSGKNSALTISGCGPALPSVYSE